MRYDNSNIFFSQQILKKLILANFLFLLYTKTYMEFLMREKMDIISFEELDSTNIYAKNNLENLSDRSVVCARRQTSGRGRLQRSWLDLGGDNLYMTIVLKPCSESLNYFQNLTQYLSVTLCKLLETYGLTPQIKWPNDVLINGKKIAGILSEAVFQGNAMKGIVLGIGVNLNVEHKNLSLVTDKEVTSLNLEVGETIDLSDFQQKLSSMFFANYDKFLKQGFEFIKSDYTSRIYFLDTEISVKGFNSTVTGIAREINDCGELVLEKDKKKLVLNIGDIL